LAVDRNAPLDSRDTESAVMGGPTPAAMGNSASGAATSPDGSTADEITDLWASTAVTGASTSATMGSSGSSAGAGPDGSIVDEITDVWASTAVTGASTSAAMGNSDQFKVLVELAPEGVKEVFEVPKDMTIRDCKEMLRQHWPSIGPNEQLLLMADKHYDRHPLPDGRSFNDIMAEIALVKARKNAGRCLDLSLQHVMPVRDSRAPPPRRPIVRAQPVVRAQHVVRAQREEQKMCPLCGAGPVVNHECGDLRAHNTAVAFSTAEQTHVHSATSSRLGGRIGIGGMHNVQPSFRMDIVDAGYLAGCLAFD